MPGPVQPSKDPAGANTVVWQGQVRAEAGGVGKGQIITARATFGSQGATDNVVKTGAAERCGVSSS